MLRLKLVPGIVLATLMAGYVQAGTNTQHWTWKFDDSGVDGSNSHTYSSEENPSGGPSLTASAYSNTRDISGEDTIQTAEFGGPWSGAVGVQNRDESTSSPWHAISGRWQSLSGGGEWDEMDSVLMDFSQGTGQKVTLTSVTVGWHYRDYDFSLIAYTGTGAPVLTGKTYSELIGNGWELVGNYYNDGIDDGQGFEGSSSSSGTNHQVSITHNTPSSYYLLSVLNPYLGADASKAGDDFFKLYAVGGKTVTGTPPDTRIPVPATAYLFALTLPLMGIWRRRSRK